MVDLEEMLLRSEVVLFGDQFYVLRRVVVALHSLSRVSHDCLPDVKPTKCRDRIDGPALVQTTTEVALDKTQTLVWLSMVLLFRDHSSRLFQLMIDQWEDA